MAEIILKIGREKSILRHHPWIFSGAIEKVNGNPRSGETVTVLTDKGDFLAKAAYSPYSNIRGRIWTFDCNEIVDTNFLNERFRQSVERRNILKSIINSDAIRLVHGESDGIPGLIVDQYNHVCVAQFLTAGVEYWKRELIEIIVENTDTKILYERSDTDARKLEGLPTVNGLLIGKFTEESLVINENGLKFHIDIINGHKTGAYLDQRDNRFLARKIFAGLKVLDCFSYTGGFALNALIGDARSVTLVDSSSKALNDAQINVGINNLPREKVDFIEQDIFRYLRFLRDKGDGYDGIVLDPPKFAPTAAQAARAARGYKDINLLAFKLLNPGGFLMTFSCSGGVSDELFQKIIAGAALDAGCEALIIERLHQPADHPVSLNFPEGAYLKGLVIQKIA